MRLALIGCGLIGASAAWAFKKANVVDAVTAYNRHIESAEKAVALGFADRTAQTIREAVADADAILVAVPVRAMRKIFVQIAQFMPPTAYVCDVGSVRGSVVADARKAFGSLFSRYAPMHPIAGGEKMGIDAARADLFCHAAVISTPESDMSKEAVEFWETLWKATGARVVRMSVKEHDATFSALSHVPHILSYALMDTVLERLETRKIASLAGGGFKDTTRIAASSPVMWRDICVSNKEAILKDLILYEKKLDAIRSCLESGDEAALEAIFVRAASARRSL